VIIFNKKTVIQRKIILSDTVDIIIIDEMDEQMARGGGDTLDYIKQWSRKQTQWILTTTTIPPEIEAFCSKIDKIEIKDFSQ
jgi:superfamily II DNA/RNA helicase